MGDGGIVLRKLRPHVAPLAVKSSALVVGFPARIQREEFVGAVANELTDCRTKRGIPVDPVLSTANKLDLHRSLVNG